MKKLLFLIVLLVATAPAFSQDYFPELELLQKIKPLETTRADVRRLLRDDENDDNNNPAERTYFEHSILNVSYGGGDCGNYADWNVPDDVVTQVDFHFSDSSKTLSLKPLWSKLERIKLDEEDEPEDGEDIDYIYFDRSSGISFEVKGDVLKGIQLLPKKERFALYCSAGQPDEPATAAEWFEEEVRDRWHFYRETWEISRVTLSHEEVFLECPDYEDQSCPDQTKIEVEITGVKAVEGFELTYNYTVSGGKIIGNGAKVIWDLAGVKPGTYTITGGADNGCGVCGTTQTKTVTVRECTACKPKPQN